MTFSIPPNFDKHLDRTKRAFDALIHRKVITAFDTRDLKTWLKNFESDEDLYLASHLLDFLVIRSSDMIASMCRNAVEQTIMSLLRADGYWKSGEYDSILKRISSGDESLPFRFVIIEDFGENPAKSAAELFRIYNRADAINKKLGIQAKRIPEQEEHIKLLILIDDFCGTGTQFCKFSKEHGLSNFSDRFSFAFVPLIAHKDADAKINEAASFVKFCPVEILSDTHNFFSKCSPDSDLWARDKFNSVDDVKQHYNKLLKSKGVNNSSNFNLNLAIGFDISTPNNTLSAYWTNKGTWKPILKR